MQELFYRRYCTGSDRAGKVMCMQILHNEIRTGNVVQEVMYRTYCRRECCTRDIEQEQLYRKRCTEHNVQKKQCTTNVIHKTLHGEMLYRKYRTRRCCTENIVHKILYRKFCTANIVQEDVVVQKISLGSDNRFSVRKTSHVHNAQL